MQYFCPVDDEVVSRADTVRGFEHARDQFVQFTEEELLALEGERSDRLDIVEFVPEASVDLVYIEDTRYVGPGKGGERAYKLLADAMARMHRVAVGRFGARGREQLVLLRPYNGGLVMHDVYYADEVRPMEEVDYPRRVAFREGENDLADRLIEQLSSDRFEPEKYRDTYRERVMEAAEQKAAGKEITAAEEQPRGQVIDLFEALKRSVSERGPGRGERAEKAAAGDETTAPIRKAAPRRRGRAGKTGTG